MASRRDESHPDEEAAKKEAKECVEAKSNDVATKNDETTKRQERHHSENIWGPFNSSLEQRSRLRFLYSMKKGRHSFWRNSGKSFTISFENKTGYTGQDKE